MTIAELLDRLRAGEDIHRLLADNAIDLAAAQAALEEAYLMGDLTPEQFEPAHNAVVNFGP